MADVDLVALLPAHVRAEIPPVVFERWEAGPAWTKAVTCVELVYGKPVTADAEVVGWLAGHGLAAFAYYRLAMAAALAALLAAGYLQ